MISKKKLSQLKRMPIIQSRVFKSRDGAFVVHKTTITDIKPTAYFNTILDNPGEEELILEEIKSDD